MSSPCSDLGRFIISSSIFFHIVIYLLDFIPLIFTFIILLCLLISSLIFYFTSFSSYLSHHMLHFLHYIIVISTSIGCSCVHGSGDFLRMWHSTHEGMGLIIGCLSLISLHFFYLITLSLHYGLCHKTTLRPWDLTFSLTAFTLIGI